MKNVSKIACIEWGVFISDFLQGNVAEENSNVIFDFEEDYVVYDGIRFDRSSLDYFFEDWVDDMYNTDWDYYGSDSDAWISLMSMTNADILKVLKQYAEDNEAEAYANGFLPDNEGVDVREWSNSLYDYFGI